MRRRLLATALLLAMYAGPAFAQAKPQVVTGSKAFAESWILGEALKQLAEETGTATAVHRRNLGGTEIVYQALRSGGVDIYVEYTGTLSEVILKLPGRPSIAEMRRKLAPLGLGVSDSLGFNDGYALAVRPETKAKYGLRRISDLRKHPNLRLGFTHEFIGREDGWLGLRARYGLSGMSPRGFDHSLAYQAIESGGIDLMEVYTTDPQIQQIGLTTLEDDRRFFPRYDAVLLYRLDLPRRAPQAFAAMEKLVGALDEAMMMRANGMVVLEKREASEAARMLLNAALTPDTPAPAAPPANTARQALRRIAADTRQHLFLVAVSLLGAILLGIPLGVLATRSRFLASLTLSTTGVLQTVPSLALLAFLIPIFKDVGVKPALVALFLYSLLPIVRNTYTGLKGLDPRLTEAAEALGLSPAARLLRIALPLASPSIMAGIKTSAVINVGTATVAAFIGAGGLGEAILSGITLRDNALILQGAIPAAVLALLIQGAFDLLDRVVIPRGLRLK